MNKKRFMAGFYNQLPKETVRGIAVYERANKTINTPDRVKKLFMEESTFYYELGRQVAMNAVEYFNRVDLILSRVTISPEQIYIECK